MLGNINGYNFRSFPKNLFLVAIDSACYRVVGYLEMQLASWCSFCRSESHGLATLDAAAGWKDHHLHRREDSLIRTNLYYEWQRLCWFAE
jgi:hypothetical protein